MSRLPKTDTPDERHNIIKWYNSNSQVTLYLCRTHLTGWMTAAAMREHNPNFQESDVRDFD